MSLPKKKSRPITINSYQLRWLVTEKSYGNGADIFIQGSGGMLSISVESVSDFGGFFWLPQESGIDTGSITPKWIREIVLQALKIGWKPEEGSSYNYQLKSNELFQISNR